MTDREGALYLERARIHVDGDRVVYHIADDKHRREYNIPHVNLAVLFIGQGTSITQSAMRLLGEEGVHLAVTGSGGTPLHMGGLTAYSSTHHFREMLPIYLDPSKSLLAAKAVMRERTARMRRIGCSEAQKWLRSRDTSALNKTCARFEASLDACGDITQLLGFEGNFSKACYAGFSGMSGLSKEHSFRREAGAGTPDRISSDPVRLVNRLIDHGNYLCYGMAGAALWALGIPPHMSVFHGKTRAGGLVFDIADSFKDAMVLPIAFSLAKEKDEKEAEKIFRGRLINAFDDREILKEAIGTVERMIAAASPQKEAPDA
ncbi:type I-F CRISPR-associated endonuclease Cas1f [Aurantimonas sp. A3-2-R12]|uniref:type I-F CRISPR-associated endonuclease Cas1f n=1 Tax=Aurantimonas sp. A3-2-R12 TaxID=3114362 RepID=UPI002E19526D|nr:type I-F CRISPR-associated endonuclease Cas1f [Aurantimonas sp. A3-2-R12]